MRLCVKKLNVIILVGVITLALALSMGVSTISSAAYAGTLAPAQVSQSATAKASTAKKSIAKAKIKLTNKSYIYTGKYITPKVTVKLGSKNLKVGTDYKIVNKTNIKATAKAKVVIKGIGDYKGSKTVTFKITKAKASKLKAEMPSVYITDMWSTRGLVMDKIEPKPTVTLNGVVLKRGTDYTLSYKNNKKLGTAQVVIKGKGSIQGAKTVKFKIQSPDKHKHNWVAILGTVKGFDLNGFHDYKFSNFSSGYRCSTCWEHVDCVHNFVVDIVYEGKNYKMCDKCGLARQV